EVARASDLLSLAFMFADLNLEVDANGARITPRTRECRVIERDEVVASIVKHKATRRGSELRSQTVEPVKQVIDARPILVVEFPPQHLFEEAVFLPNAPELPDADVVELDSNGMFEFDPKDLSEKARAMLNIAEDAKARIPA